MESLARRSKIVVRKMQELEGRMYVEKGSGNVTRIKTGIVIEGNWKKKEKRRKKMLWQGR